MPTNFEHVPSAATEMARGMAVALEIWMPLAAPQDALALTQPAFLEDSQEGCVHPTSRFGSELTEPATVRFM